ncbi:DUF6491 family protein [Sphingomonas sp. BT-65]|uniref:DUF6491 family protein n=1 Tax=Sphingomonas sp. BT-65 TaxID=2989821 RepID=UPI00223560B1|nr:DUF6491 family protein [Sphingomonas sp. BT-65]MCW4462227.1 DUF6491 family protein [Sphingomonas sp. BT-65]
MTRLIRPFAAAALAVASLSALPAAAQEPRARAVKEARIPFASMVSDYRAEERDVIYLRAGRDWYRGTFMAPCQELPWAWNIRFENSPGIDAIDRFSTVIARGERCRLNSLIKIDGQPPAKAKKPARKKD